MEEIIFVTHNKGKIATAKKHLKDVNFSIYEYDLEEPRSDDIKYISKVKVEEAYALVKKPCISMDAGFFIDVLNGFISESILGNEVDNRWSDLWYIFIPENYTKTLAQMTKKEREERERSKADRSSMKAFANWYIERAK